LPIKVTIGVCVRNSEAFVKDAIDSIMKQDFPHSELKVVFVDDGSEDNTLAVIQGRIREMDMVALAIRSDWKGLGHSRNLVLKNAEGDYILWVDGDMILSKDFTRELVEFMERHPKVGAAKGKQALERGANSLSTLEAYSRAAGRMVDYSSDKGRYRALGTGGAIYRTAAIAQVGGFDENLRGYGEDWDAEIRMRNAGWGLDTVDATFSDYERYKITWKSLWRRYWLRGYYTHYFLHKNRGLIKHYRMFPPAAFATGIFQSRKLFRLTYQKAVFFLPFQNVFKMTAWYLGFARSHGSRYQPRYGLDMKSF